MKELIGTEWLFWFTPTQKSKIESLYINHEEDVKTWMFFSIALPTLTYLFSVLANVLIVPTCQLPEKLSSILNNGSLPIISFGIVSAGVSYLMEQIDADNLDFHQIRRRIMSVATILLFLTAGLFIFQSILPNISTHSESWKHLISFIVSLILIWFSASVGIKMYFLQGSFVNDFKASVDDKKKDLNKRDDEFHE